MALTTLQILTLSNLKGVGPKSILNFGNAVRELKIPNNMVMSNYLTKQKVKMTVPNPDYVPGAKDQKQTIKVNITESVLDDSEKKAEQIMKEHLLQGIGIISYYDPKFPEALRRTVDEDGNPSAPILLYYKGDWSVTEMPCVAIIGTREITEAGKAAGMYLGSKFAEAGFCIVSGLAIGCDTVGHESALSVNGKTIAFLAHGLDSVYPPQNEDLAKKILNAGGLLVSEYPIGTSVSPYYLVARDRLQAGMSQATLVIQTGINGGTMHAANATYAAKKPLYVVKFKNDDDNKHNKSLGNEQLVKDHKALYLSGGDDLNAVFERISPTLRHSKK